MGRLGGLLAKLGGGKPAPTGPFCELQDLAPYNFQAGIAVRAVEGKQLTFTVAELGPHAVVPEHTDPQDHVGMMAAGSATFRIGDETQEVRAGAVWRLPKGLPHAIDAGPDGAVMIDCFAPIRDDWGWAPRLDPSTPAWPPA